MSDKVKADKKQPSEKPPGRLKKWGKRLLLLFVVFCIFLVGLYYYVCSAGFFRQWVQPEVETALGKSLSFESYSLSPFGHLRLGGVRIGEPGDQGENPPLTLKTLECEFKALSLLQNRLEVTRFLLDSLQVQVVQNADGSLRGPFPDIAAAISAKPSTPSKPRTPGPQKTPAKTPPPPASLPSLDLPYALDLSNMEIRKLNIRFDRYLEGAAQPERITVKDFSFTCPRFSSDGDSTLKLSAGFQARLAVPDATGPAGGGFEEASTNLAIDIDIAAKEGTLKQIASRVLLSEAKGTIQGQSIESYVLELDPTIDLASAGEIHLPPAALKIRSDEGLLGQINFAADWNLAAQSGRTSVTLSAVDRRVLNLAAPSHGMDFRDTKISGASEIAYNLSKGLQTLEARLTITDLNPTGGPLPAAGFPSTDLDFLLEAAPSTDSKALSVNVFQLKTSQQIPGGKQDILTGSLKKPLRLDPATFLPEAGAIGKDAFTLALQNFRLSDWQALLPPDLGVHFDQGVLSGNLNLGEVPGQAERFQINGSLLASNLKGTALEDAFGPLSIATQILADADPKGNAKLHPSTLSLKSGAKNLGSINLTGDLQADPMVATGSLQVKDLDLTAIPHSALAEVRKSIQRAQVSLSTNLRFDESKNQAVMSGLVSLKPLVAYIPDDPEKQTLTLPLDLQFDQTVDLSQSRLDIKKADLTLYDGTKPAGTLTLTGYVNFAQDIAGNLQIKTDELRLTPFQKIIAAYADMLDTRELAITLDENVTFNLGEKTIASAKGVLKASGLKPLTEKPQNIAPLSLALDQDIDFRDPLIDLKKLQIGLVSGPAKPDLIDIVGQVNLTEVPTGALTLHSESIDLQPLLAYGDIHPTPDAPPLKAERLDLQLDLGETKTLLQKLTVDLASGNIALDSLSIEPSEKTDPLIEWKGLAGKGIDVNVLLSNFAPEYAGRFTGTARFDSAGQIRGFTEEALNQSCRAIFEASVADGELQELPIIDELAKVTNLPELKRIVFISFDSRLETTAEGVMVRQADLLGDLQKIQITGRVGYDESLDLTQSLALGGRLGDKAKGQKYAKFLKTDANGFLIFPMPLAIKGSFSEPKIRIEFPKEALINIGIDLLNKELDKEKKKEEEKEQKDNLDPKKEEKEDIEDQIKKIGIDLLGDFLKR